MDFDISKYQMVDSAILTVQNMRRTGDLLGTDGKAVTIEIWSAGSEEGVQALQKAGLAIAARLSRINRGAQIKPSDAENAEAEKAMKLIAMTKKISENFPVTRDTLYSDPKLRYIANQVEEFLNEDGNFAPASTES